MNYSESTKDNFARAISNCLRRIYIYTGSKPTDPNSTPTGTMLAELYIDQANVIEGYLDIVRLYGTAVATGTAGYAVWQTVGTTGAGGTLYGQLFLTVGTSSAELILSKLDIVSGDVLNGTGRFTVIS